MNSTELAAAAGLLVASALYYLAVRAARKHRWPSWILVSLSALSGEALLVMVLTDWPGEQLSTFWADHSVFTAVLSTVLLVSIGYLAFEAGETSKQAELD